MSICDHCYAPGYCCKGFTVHCEDGERTFWLEGKDTVAKHIKRRKWPFIATETGRFIDKDSGKEYASYKFHCPHLTAKGRCAIWQQRPKICRDFEPAGGSPLCIHSHGAEGTGDGL